MSEKIKMPVANIAPFGLRMQPDLKARIEKSARQNNRSMNAEIVELLERSIALEALEAEVSVLREQAKRDDETFTEFHKNQEYFMRTMRDAVKEAAEAVKIARTNEGKWQGMVEEMLPKMDILNNLLREQVDNKNKTNKPD